MVSKTLLWKAKNPERWKAQAKKANAKNYANRKAFLDGYKTAHGCRDCGISNPVVLAFHHRDPSTKEFVVANGKTKPMARIIQEIEKCDVICANCHLIEHEKQRQE